MYTWQRRSTISLLFRINKVYRREVYERIWYWTCLLYTSLERYFHKEISRVQSIWYAQQSENGIKYPRSSKHIKRIYRKKQDAVKDYLHKVTRWLAEYCRKEGISCVIIGDIRNIRKGKEIGHRANQKFHGLPYNKLYIMLEYKLKLYGIPLIKQEESYTSRCLSLIHI